MFSQANQNQVIEGTSNKQGQVQGQEWEPSPPVAFALFPHINIDMKTSTEDLRHLPELCF